MVPAPRACSRSPGALASLSRLICPLFEERHGLRVSYLSDRQLFTMRCQAGAEIIKSLPTAVRVGSSFFSSMLNFAVSDLHHNFRNVRARCAVESKSRCSSRCLNPALKQLRVGTSMSYRSPTFFFLILSPCEELCVCCVRSIFHCQ